MNTAVTSGEEILAGARRLALEKGLEGLGMRRVAQVCGVAVGTVYRYFPDKTALMIAVVSSVWRDVFAPLMKPEPWESALALVRAIGSCVREGRERYPGFFAGHALTAEDLDRARAAMEEAVGHMRDMLVRAFRRDMPDGRKPLTPEALADAALDFIKLDLMTGRDRMELLEALLTPILKKKGCQHASNL